MKTKSLKRKQKTQPGGSLEPVVGRGDHEMISFRGRLIPVLGTVGGTAEESRQTARNIERFFAANDRGQAQPPGTDADERKTVRRKPRLGNGNARRLLPGPIC